MPCRDDVADADVARDVGAEVRHADPELDDLTGAHVARLDRAALGRHDLLADVDLGRSRPRPRPRRDPRPAPAARSGRWCPALAAGVTIGPGLTVGSGGGARRGRRCRRGRWSRRRRRRSGSGPARPSAIAGGSRRPRRGSASADGVDVGVGVTVGAAVGDGVGDGCGHGVGSGRHGGRRAVADLPGAAHRRRGDRTVDVLVGQLDRRARREHRPLPGRCPGGPSVTDDASGKFHSVALRRASRSALGAVTPSCT